MSIFAVASSIKAVSKNALYRHILNQRQANTPLNQALSGGIEELCDG
jgi:hypothetical protein